MTPTPKNKKHLKELALVFLKLGTLGFGGPAAHLAMMETEIVERREWISKEELLDYISAANFIPGPNSTEVAIHIGYKMGGLAGLVIAGSCFILPAALIVTTVAWLYVTYGALPEVQTVLAGIKPVIIAVVVQALWILGKSALKNKTQIGIGVLAFVSALLGLNELAIIFLSGGFAALILNSWNRKDVARALAPLGAKPLVLTGGALAAAAVALPFSLTKLFLFFLKVGSVLFGSGYVLVAFLRGDLVERWHWLSESQLLDAIAVGQFTPGPVFTTATFIGYLLAGSQGAVISTLGIFLPAFFFVAVSAPWIAKVRSNKKARSFLDGLNVGSLAIMAFAALLLAKSAVVDRWSLGLAVGSAILLIRYKLNSLWLVLTGAAAGFLRG